MLRLALLAASLLIGVAFGAGLRLGAFAPVTMAAAQATERVLVDMTVEVSAHTPQGHCFVTEAGTLTAMVQLVEIETTGLQPVSFGLAIGPNVTAPSIDTMVTPVPATYSIPALGAVYCYGLDNKPPEVPRDQPPPRAFRQRVALRLAWSPPAP